MADTQTTERPEDTKRATPMLDKIAAGDALDESGQIAGALKELEVRHNAALHSSRRLKAELQCTIDGWVIFYDEGYSRPTELRDYRNRFAYPEDAIKALHERVEEWIAQTEGEDAEPCTDAARKAGCTCSMSSVNSASIDPPEPRVDRDCPLHGRRDPDAERQKRLDERSAP